MEIHDIVPKLSKRLLGCRIKVTQENSLTKTIRFERRVERVEISDEEGFIELRLNKNVPSEYGLLKQRIIHFCPRTKTYRGIPGNPHHEQEHHIFKVEVVGLRYIAHMAELEDLGISVSGHDVRVIMFEKVLPRVVYPEYGKRIMEMFGSELKECARGFLQDSHLRITAKEKYVVDKYLSTD